MKKKWFFVAFVVFLVAGLVIYARSKATQVDALVALVEAYEKQSGGNGQSSNDLDLNALLGALGTEEKSNSDVDLNALLGALGTEERSDSDVDLNALLGALDSNDAAEQDSSDMDAILEALGGLNAKEEENGDNLDAILGALNELNSNALTEEGLENMINEFLWGESEEELQIVPGELSAEFKQIMDSYEGMVDESIAFMKKIENANESTVMGLYAELESFMERFTTIQDQVQTLGKGPMTTDEYEYYQEVMERISEKKNNMDFDMF